MRKHLISILTILLFSAVLFSISAETINELNDTDIVGEYFSLISESDINILEKDKELTLFLEKDQSPVYLPMIDERIELSSIINKSSFNTGIETVFLHREKEYIKSIKRIL